MSRQPLPRIPSVNETVRLYAWRSFFGDNTDWRWPLLAGVLLLGLALSLPPIESVDPSRLLLMALVLFGPVSGAAYREYKFGGPPRLALAAAISTALVSLAILGIFLGLWRIFGGRTDFAGPFGWFFSLPMDIQVGSLLALMVLLLVGYFVRKPARQRAAAAFDAEVRAERARRGRAPAG